jgi:hypothetical protein
MWNVELLIAGDVLTGGEVLPGFSMPVVNVFRDPFESQ